LYYAAGSPVNVTFTGTRSEKNEYLKIWTSTDKNNTNPKEATASVNNTVGSDLKRQVSLNVDLDNNEKMVVQAYYDDFEYDTDANGAKTLKRDAQGNPLYKSYPLGEQYVFYIPSNFHATNDPTGEKSNNALLSSLKISGYTLKDSDGNQGFSSDKSDYTTAVAKEDTTAKITAIAQDDNIKSIVATVDSSKETYDLVSGELSELPLNPNGKTNIKIAVTAQDGTTIKNYTVVVANNTKGSAVNLKNVILNVGDYTFDPKADVTKVREDQNVTSVKVTPVPQDPKSKITVNGQEFSDSPINVNIKGAQKTTVNIEVKSEDGTTSKTYTLEINRVDVADWNPTPNNGEDPNENDQFYDEYSQCWVDTTKYDEWGTVNGKPTYFDKKSRQVKDAWITTGGKLYYLNNLGYRASGWKVDAADGKTYYLDPTTGEMKKQWMNLDNKWYYLGLNGVMQKGWLNLNNKWYYFTPNGQMVVGQTMYIDDEVCRFGQDGAKY
jgi:glucan-binding YG repeat protein